MRLKTILILILISLIACNTSKINKNIIKSPNKKLNLSFFLTNNNQPAYTLLYKNTMVLDTSLMAFVLKKSPALKTNFKIIGTEFKTFNKSWKPVWGEYDSIENNYNKLKIHLKETSNLKRELYIVFKLYDEGLGFRYEFPKQPNLNKVVIMDEQTQFHLTNDATAWWIPADYDSYEYHYTKSKVSEINALKAGYEQRHDRHSNNLHAVNTPVTLKTNEGLYVSIHEANLTNYSGMTLAVKNNNTLQSELVPALDGNTVKVNTPFVTPWRTIQVVANAKNLVSKNLILNLNEPNKIEDTSWIKPMKYDGIWWEIHIGKSSWDYGTGKHGANTKNAFKYIDFASKNNIKGMLVEGWNIGWDNWGDKTFSLTQPYPDFDIEKIIQYGKKKGVTLIGHHETFGNAGYYDSIVEKAFKYYNKLGVHYVKTGYASSLLPKEYHHGQYMVNHYRKVVQLAAKYHICIDAHEPIKATGIRRTYPNMMTREGVKGMEYNAWGGGNPPSHTTILPFTRGLAGPIDYTPGIFDIKFKSDRKDQFVRSTLAKQLALYVVLYSPLQMVADLPENYKNQPRLNFIKDVPTDWSKTKIINGEIGEYITIARKEKDKENWFIGSITNETEKNLNIPLNFLNIHKKYLVTLYKDTEKSNWKSNPTAYKIDTTVVTYQSILKVKLAPGGGCAITIKEIQ